MSDTDRSVVVSMGSSDELDERFPSYHDRGEPDEIPDAGFPASLVSLGFITAALRRGARQWCAAAIAGFLLGLGLSVALAPTYQATTSVVLAPPPSENAPDSIQTDAALAQSHTVAGLALRRLGLPESVNSFLSTYAVTVITDRVLLITVSAPSSSEAVARARVLAAVFLQFRVGQLETDQKLVLSSLNQQINGAKQYLRSIDGQISQARTQLASPARRARLSDLRAERSKAAAALVSLERTTTYDQTSTQAAITTTIKGSGVLDHAAAVPQSGHAHLKRLLSYAITGLIAGLALGMAVVVIRALVSDRLRRRDDVAHALDAPVKLSVPAVRLSRWLPRRHGLAATRNAHIRRIAKHLNALIVASPHGKAALALVPVDDPQVAALSLVSLAITCAEQGRQVVVADLSSRAHAARLLGANDPGIMTASVSDGTHLVVVVPDRDEVAPVGPVRGTPHQALPRPAMSLVAATEAADFLLTLAPLDPAVGGEHLATWATDAVVTVTAGRSSWTKIHAVAEMIRLAGARLNSAVLVGADKTDESLGVTNTSGAGRDAGVAKGLSAQ
jgi:capsular polysaccharide biosynthesis protein